MVPDYIKYNVGAAAPNLSMYVVCSYVFMSGETTFLYYKIQVLVGYIQFQYILTLTVLMKSASNNPCCWKTFNQRVINGLFETEQDLLLVSAEVPTRVG